jgi:hypothetical protein
MKDLFSKEYIKIVMPDGKIKQANGLVRKYLLSIGGRELILQPINLNYENQTRGSSGTSEVPKPRRGRKPRRSEK